MIYIAGVACVLIAGSLFILNKKRNQNEVNRHTVNIKYRFILHNTTSAVIHNAGLLAGIPFPCSGMQSSLNNVANHPFTVVQDKVGNTGLELNWDLIAPFTTKVVIITSEIEVLQTRHSQSSKPDTIYLEPEPFIESNHHLIVEAADKLAAKKNKATALNIFNWVSKHIQYQGYVEKNRGAVYALKHRKGDCTEFATLFVALCRAAGIPARYMGGFVASNSAVLTVGDYHNWAEFYDEGRWNLVDPQRKVFVDDPEASSYIAYKVILPSKDTSGALITQLKGTGLRVRSN
jgi:transglutaminase-like putative cysteine protease